MQVKTILREYGVRDLAEHGHANARRGFENGIRRALVEIERHHKRKEMLRSRGGQRLSSGDIAPPDPFKITNRTGNLSRSYRGAVMHGQLQGAYGSDIVYAPVHEFGSPAKNIRPRPGLQNTVNALDAKIEQILADSTREGIDGK